ncbi:MAG: PilZ domain-containing protein [Humidesulfovibrio sp.]
MNTSGPASSPPSGSDHRGSARHTVLVAGRLRCEGESQTCEVVNVSVGGAKLRVLGIYCPGQELTLEIKACGQFPGVVAWVRGDEVGLKFTCDPAQTAEALIALATYG